VKLNGKQVFGAFEAVVAIPRLDGPLVFIARAIMDYEPFDKLCPQPKAPLIQFAGQAAVENIEDVNYKKAIDEWVGKKTHWMVLQSLRATPDLVWDTVIDGDHSTWANYQKEMATAGLSPAEQARIIMCVSEANGLDQSKIDEATESFLAGRAALAASGNYHVSGQLVTPSGVLVNA
jgi:hypothetical protein